MNKFLVIEENIDNLINIKNFLKEAFPVAVVLTATEGNEGIQLAESELPDAILLEKLRNVTDGFEVCRRIKSQSRLRDIPVIIIIDPEENRKILLDAIEAGADLYIRNPLDLPELQMQIKAMLKIRAANILVQNEKERLETIIQDKTELELVKASGNWRQIFEAIHDGIALLDANQIIIQSNRAFQDLILTNKTNPSGQQCFAFVHDSNCQVENCPFIRMKHSKNRESTEMEIDNKIYEIIVDPILDSNGEISGAVHIMTDLTQRKHSENVQRILYEISKLSMSRKSIEELLVIVSEKLSHVIDTTNFFVALYKPENDTLRKVIFKDEKDDFTEWSAGNTFSGLVIKLGQTLLLDKEKSRKIAAEHHFELVGTPSECWLGVPLLIDQKPIGVLVVQSYINAKAFSQSDARMLEIVAHELAVVLEREIMIQNLINAKEKAEENEFFLKESQKAGNIGSYHANFTNEQLTISETLKKILGFSNDFNGSISDYLKFVHTDDREMLEKYLTEEIIQRHNKFNKEFRIIRQTDSETRWVSGMGEVTCDDNGNNLSLIGTIQDITTHKKLEQEQFRLLNIIENSKNEIYVFDSDTLKFEYANQEALYNLGYKQDEITQLTPLDIKPEFTESSFKKMVEPLISGSKSKLQFETIHRRKNGTFYPVEVYLHLHDQGEKKLFFAVINDYTEQKLAKEALRESESTARTLINTSNNLTMLLDKDFNIIDINEVGSKWLGHEIHEMVGNYVFDFISADSAKTRLKKFKEATLIGEPVSFEDERNGRYFFNRIGPVKDENGQVFRFAVYATDITEQKRTENELIKAKEKAEESDRLKSAFLANISHEIRTPMTGILGFAELLKDPHLSGQELLEYIGIIEKSGARMLNIINDLINISKVESGQMEVSYSKTNINEKLGFLYNFFKPEAKQKGINLSVNCPLPASRATLITDKEKIFAILSNLIKNAIKFTLKGSVEFGYELKGEFFEFYVKDTGIGIPGANHASVFDRFVQANQSLSSGYEGAGLGLAIAKAYVEMLGGKIWLESEEGIGTSFYFTTPCNMTLPEGSLDEKEEIVK